MDRLIAQFVVAAWDEYMASTPGAIEGLLVDWAGKS